ncbi:MAG: hypothetical protein K2J95_01380 [Lachnospiraceae bacterium]|nr:hypothetical protein [Lachnospiraceae bacterium]
MAIRYKWMINLSGNALPVYSEGYCGPSETQIGTITKNECFLNVNTTDTVNPWEGDGEPVFFLNSSHQMKDGFLADSVNNLVKFTNYASNGTSWVSVNTLERKVQYETATYDSEAKFKFTLPAGSRVWISSSGTAGEQYRNFIAVTHVQRGSEGTKEEFNGFVDLTYGNRWINVGSILLRKV